MIVARQLWLPLVLSALGLTALHGGVQSRHGSLLNARFPADAEGARERVAVPSGLAEDVGTLLQDTLPEWLAEAAIPGAAVAVVDDRGIAWTMAYGSVDRAASRPVDDETIFAIQSMSKSFTALAVLMAVQDGLVDLDTPIAEYLPDFTVNSLYDERPERLITLRHLLAHRAGFTHQAPFGSYYDDRNDFERHIASISTTWLRFPVGYRPDYSNLGIDLAGYVVQARSGMPFETYVREKVLQPLGMTGTTLDMDVIEQTANRAVGHVPYAERVPLRIPMIPAGGVYSNVRDMARYLRFHINAGVLDGRRVLRADLMEAMHTVQFAAPGQRSGWALGLLRDPSSDSYTVYHSGAGRGFQSDMVMYPEKHLGVVLLTNAEGHDVGQWRLRQLVQGVLDTRFGPTPWAPAEFGRMTALAPDDPRVRAVLGRYGARERVVIAYADGALSLQPPGSDRAYPIRFFDDDGDLVGLFGVNGEIRFLPPRGGERGDLTLVDRQLSNQYTHVFPFNDSPADPPGPDRPEWSRFLGPYTPIWPGAGWTAEASVRNGYLYFGENRCLEHEPGWFFSTTGEVFDLRSATPTWANIELRRIPAAERSEHPS
jgi:CubicO group peptidase (beta-lactamase class C family)